ncbi:MULTISPECIES: RNA-guided pseudouridylation complex pseudouridine synthase subunit Cbf5 [Metallosphaera]|uniref:tRNA pseudouridine synthase B n=3 Tax=Metallosphaera TaxID=41980 RepID=A4YCT2_METS5|nr:MULTISPECIES: RNA-guided pseudouridylation complex pseudouridine synthase subunit Cbf5 [Metallosphaera]ABP94234.1 tRNA pseudouridine synthase B [Metallosphaera sedula DSM 5348]AIM26221.1 tRNA pseudouridine synthase B [Metallosphaera sedula]AKV73242.1 tRNA pseudouridine synthase B [Metallosphaera sedula]AKV75486.1 tRNA pseudouridine synthase B [Metallosphaera sedula]AKV77732.1 tRNA pseudouridine synthase B [Metallosphaera sedula]
MSVVTKSGKEYVCLMEVHCDFQEERLRAIAKEFVGTIYQKPPVRSSVKRRVRKRKIYSLEVLEMEGRRVLMKISSEPGTYMRKICHDMGILLGCGAHMRELRRTRSGIFTEDTVVTLQQVSEALYLYRNCGEEDELRRILIPMEMAFCGIPKIIVDDETVNSLAYGSPLMAPGIVAFQGFKKGDTVALITWKGEGIALGKALVDSVSMGKRGEVVKPERVLMDKDVYPKAWKK